jgi:hypothetical protein
MTKLVNRMGHRAFFVAPLLGLLLLSHCGPDAPNPLAPPDPQTAALQQLTDSVALQVAAIRGKPFLRKVIVRLQTSEHYLQEMQADSAMRNYAQFSPHLNHFFTRTALVRTQDNVTDYVKTQQEYYAQFPSAYYQVGSDTITIMSRDAQYRDVPQMMDNPEFTVILAHELTHALQDQQLGAFSPLRSDNESSDQVAAHACMVEGEASLTEALYLNRYLLGGLGGEEQELIGRQATLAQALYDTVDALIANGGIAFPPFMWLPLVQRYFVGTAWMAHAYKRAQWAGVDEQYGQQTLSMLEVMSLDTLSAVVLNLERFENYVNTDHFVIYDVFGAFDVSMMLGLNTAPGAVGPSLRHRFGYRGDRILYWSPSGSQPGAFIWAFSFEDDVRARSAFELLGKVVQNAEGIAARPKMQLQSIDSTTNAPFIIARYSQNGQNAALLYRSKMLFWVDNTASSQESILVDIINPALAKRKAAPLPSRSFRPPQRTY